MLNLTRRVCSGQPLSHRHACDAFFGEALQQQLFVPAAASFQVRCEWGVEKERNDHHAGSRLRASALGYYYTEKKLLLFMHSREHNKRQLGAERKESHWHTHTHCFMRSIYPSCVLFSECASLQVSGREISLCRSASQAARAQRNAAHHNKNRELVQPRDAQNEPSSIDGSKMHSLRAAAIRKCDSPCSLKWRFYDFGALRSSCLCAFHKFTLGY